MKCYYVYFICLLACYLLPSINAARNSEYFKVPHNPNRHLNDDRPPRLVDNKSDPDMIKLKNIQEEFFGLLSNTTLGTEFNGFTDILLLVESGVGKQLGLIFANGVGVGFAKENSMELLYEFWDEFRYRLPYDLSTALIDYTDFFKSVDISLIPMTIELLFQKDHLGNSLAQMPLGQLIDLVQPEATRYGIDIRSFVNEIIGKGDSKFPEIMRGAMQNLNFESLFNILVEFIPKEFGSNRIGSQSQSNDGTSLSSKTSQLEGALNLFKPLIANLLKGNGIDLEAEAVIQVIIPFAGAAGEYFTQTMEDGGNNFDLSMLAPLLGLLNTGKGKENNPLAVAAKLMGNFDINKDKGISSMINMASQFMGNMKTSGKKGKGGNGLDVGNILKMAGQLSGNDGEIDVNNILTTAASFLNTKNGGSNDGEGIMGIIGKISKGESIDTTQILATAASLLQDNAPGENVIKTLSNDNQVDQKTPNVIEANEGIGFMNIIKPIIAALKRQKDLSEKIKSGIKWIKDLLTSKNISTDSFEKFFLTLTGLKELPATVDMDVIIGMATSFSYKQYDELILQLEIKSVREMIIIDIATPIAQTVTMLAADEVDQAINRMFKNISTQFESYGIKDVTFDNFPEKLQIPLTMFTAISKIPVDLVPLLNPLRTSLQVIIKWKKEATTFVREMPKHELGMYVSESIDKDVILPLTALWKAYGKSLVNPRCFPRAVCDVIIKMKSKPIHSPLTIPFTRLMSLIMGLGGAYADGDIIYRLEDIFMMSFTEYNECQTIFPITCDAPAEKLTPPKPSPDHHAKMREDL